MIFIHSFEYDEEIYNTKYLIKKEKAGSFKISCMMPNLKKLPVLSNLSSLLGLKGNQNFGEGQNIQKKFH